MGASKRPFRSRNVKITGFSKQNCPIREKERIGQFYKGILQRSHGEEGKWHFTHRRTRRAFYSLKRNLDVLFTYENFPKNDVPRTNNAIEALNSVLKMKLRLHRGISTESRQRLIANLLTAYKPNKH